ncbi:MAG: hypothetical protein ABEH43_09745 [Flavobacteriales bacterium]
MKWLANMVTHYRHDHIRYWDQKWSKGGYGWKNLSEETYEKEKAQVNNRAKRQIIRKTQDFLVEHGIDSNVFRELIGTEEDTIALAKKILDDNMEKEVEPKNQSPMKEP